MKLLIVLLLLDGKKSKGKIAVVVTAVIITAIAAI